MKLNSYEYFFPQKFLSFKACILIFSFSIFLFIRPKPYARVIEGSNLFIRPKPYARVIEGSNNNIVDKDVVDYGSRDDNKPPPPVAFHHPDMESKKHMFDQKVTYTKFT